MFPITGLLVILGGPGSFDPLCRYVFGLPGALLAALAMLVYAPAAGLIVSGADFWPATWLNYDSWLVTTGFPIQLLRTACSIGCLVGVWWHCVAGSRETEERHRALYEMSRDAILMLKPPPG